MGVFLALGSLVIIVATAILGALKFFRKEPVWKDWLLGTLVGFILFFISLFTIPGPTSDPTVTITPEQTTVPSQQQPTSPSTTSSSVYNK